MTFVSYAQNFEDVRLWRAFSDVVAGRYLDIGTQDPVRDSVSLAFYERGWRGVHVEPTPAYAAAMRAARPDETVIEAAVATSPGPMRFFEIPTTGLSTGAAAIAHRHRDAGWECREIVVPTVTLAGLFNLIGPDLIHWLKIDVEGMEADVLESWGDHPARPAALVIEATAPGTQNPTHEGWHATVIERGYIDVLFDGLSRYFVHNTCAERGDALALSPNVFDGFQVYQKHFAAGHLGQLREAELAAVRAELEADRDRQVAARALVERAAADEAARLQEANVALAEQERRSAEHARDQTTALGAAQSKVAVTELALAEVTHQLHALRQDHLVLARENGQLEGQLKAQSEAYASRLTDAEAARRETAGRLDRAELALISAQTEVAELRGRLTLQASSHRDALAKAVQLHALEVEALTAANAECDRLQLVLSRIEQQLADQIGLSNALTAQRSDLEAHRDVLVVEIEAVRQQAAAEALALNDRIAQLHHHIEWRERQLQAASALLDGIPQPLAGLPRLLAAFVRRWRSAAGAAVIASHQEAREHWQRDLMLPLASEVRQEESGSHVSQASIANAAGEYGGVEIMESDEPVTSVPRLIAPHDREFIYTAYQAVLGRAPDQEGEAYYLARLRAGTHKLEILKQLRHSSEGAAFIPGVAGLDRAIRRYRWATLPLIGVMLRLLWGAEGNGATHRALRVLANDVGRMHFKQAELREEQTALVREVRELSARSYPQSDVAKSPRAVDLQPETGTLTGFTMTAQDFELSDPSLSQGASQILRLLASNMRARQTQRVD